MMEKISRLNALRGFAALIVMVSHFSNGTGVFGKLLGDGAGQVGVMLFFVLSGFLMSYLYVAKEPTFKNVFNFFVARFARIAPLFIFVVLVAYVMTTFFQLPGFYKMQGVGNLVSHLLLLKGNNVLWTIPVEIHFYMLFALFWWMTKRFRGAWLFLLAALLWMCVRPIPRIEFSVAGHALGIGIFSYINFFILGVLFGAVFRAVNPLLKYKNKYWVLSLSLVLLCFPNVAKLLGLEIGLWADPRSLLLIGFIFFIILFVVSDDCVLVSNRFTDFLGEISFGLYLMHSIILYYVLKSSFSGYTKVVLFFGLSILMASLSYYLLERPTRRMLRRLFLD